VYEGLKKASKLVPTSIIVNIQQFLPANDDLVGEYIFNNWIRGEKFSYKSFYNGKTFSSGKKKNLNYEKKLQKYQIKTLYLYKFRKQVKKKENERY
jgi:hypothetical protein